MLAKPRARLMALAITAIFITAACYNPCVESLDRVVNVNQAPLVGDTVTVLTYNLLHGLGSALNDQSLSARLELVALELLELRPDVVLLQEASVTGPGAHCNVVDTLRRRLNTGLAGTGLSYNSFHSARHGSSAIDFYEGPAVLSRARILEAVVTPFRSQVELPPEQRLAVRATLLGELGDVDVLSTHLTNQDDLRDEKFIRTQQATELVERVIAERLRGLPLVVGGDMNAVPGSGTVGALIAGGGVDVWSAARPGETGATSLVGPIDDPASRAEERIDYLFAFADGAQVLEADLFLDAPRPVLADGRDGELWPSDHIGVVGRLRLPR